MGRYNGTSPLPPSLQNGTVQRYILRVSVGRYVFRVRIWLAGEHPRRGPYRHRVPYRTRPFREVVWYGTIFWEANTFRHAQKQKIALWRSGSSIRTMSVADGRLFFLLVRSTRESPLPPITVGVSVSPCTVGCVGRVVYGRVSKPPQARGAETRNTYLPTDTLI